MRKKLAGLRPRLVHGAHVAFEEDAAILIALQDTAFVRCFDGIVTNKLVELQPQKAAEMLYIALCDLGCGNPAAISARGAVDLIFNLLCDCFETAFDEVVAPEPGTEALVFFAVLLPVALNLYEVC